MPREFVSTLGCTSSEDAFQDSYRVCTCAKDLCNTQFAATKDELTRLLARFEVSTQLPNDENKQSNVSNATHAIILFVLIAFAVSFTLAVAIYGGFAIYVISRGS